MNYSPFEDLLRVLNVSFPGAVLFLFNAIVPWVFVVIFRSVTRLRIVYKATLYGAGLTTSFAFVSLLTLGPPSGLSPAGLWYFAFIYGFLPLWLAVSILIWMFLYVRSRIRNRSA